MCGGERRCDSNMTPPGLVADAIRLQIIALASAANQVLLQQGSQIATTAFKYGEYCLSCC